MKAQKNEAFPEAAHQSQDLLLVCSVLLKEFQLQYKLKDSLNSATQQKVQFQELQRKWKWKKGQVCWGAWLNSSAKRTSSIVLSVRNVRFLPLNQAVDICTISKSILHQITTRAHKEKGFSSMPIQWCSSTAGITPVSWVDGFPGRLSNSMLLSETNQRKDPYGLGDEARCAMSTAPMHF